MATENSDTAHTEQTYPTTKPRGRRQLFLLIVGYICLLGLAVSHFPENVFTQPDEKWLFNKAEFATSDLIAPDTVELPTLSWEQVELPDDWKAYDREALAAWYRFTLEPQLGGETRHWAVYLPAAIQNPAVYLNGQWIGEGGSFTPLTHGWNQPRFFEFPRDSLEETNEVLVFLRGLSADDNLLGNVYIGPSEELKPFFQKLKLFRVDGVLAASYVMAFIAVFLGYLWLRRAKDSVYGWLALGCLAFCLWNQNLVIDQLPLSFERWHAIIMTAQGMTVLFVIMSAYRYFGAPPSKMDRWVLILSFLGALPLFITSSQALLNYTFLIWNALCLVLGLIALIRMFYAVFTRETNLQYRILLFAMLTTMIFGLRDFWTLSTIGMRDNPLLIQYGFLIIVGVHAWIVILRFVEALDESENLNVHLDQRVKQRENELEQNYQAMQRMERDRVLDQERTRIMQDMHDGIGGQLVSLLSMVNLRETKPEELKSRLRDSISELRLTISSLDPAVKDIDSLMALFERRIESPLAAAGIELVWKQSGEPPTTEIDPGRGLQLMRLLQEGATNAIKHSGANQLQVLLNYSKDKLQVILEDDGCGINARDSSGHGLNNMKDRAMRLAGELKIEDTGKGTRLQLDIPLTAGH